ncbi:hypothetical protein B0H13DRAFT_2360573 [Mycena leptocephala]|nr:hypothetical protein B0H13DRAFT_2360573 [Mycena leptocephala]
MHAFHNAHLLRAALPRDFIAPVPSFEDRRAKHDEFASTLRDTRAKRAKKKTARTTAKKGKRRKRKTAPESELDDGDEGDPDAAGPSQPRSRKRARTAAPIESREQLDGEGLVAGRVKRTVKPSAKALAAAEGSEGSEDEGFWGVRCEIFKASDPGLQQGRLQQLSLRLSDVGCSLTLSSHQDTLTIHELKVPRSYFLLLFRHASIRGSSSMVHYFASNPMPLDYETPEIIWWSGWYVYAHRRTPFYHNPKCAGFIKIVVIFVEMPFDPRLTVYILRWGFWMVHSTSCTLDCETIEHANHKEILDTDTTLALIDDAVRKIRVFCNLPTFRRELIQNEWNKIAREARAAGIELYNDVDEEEVPPGVHVLFPYVERSYLLWQ